MAILLSDDKQFQHFIENTEGVIERLTPKASEKDIRELEKLVANFKIKIEDFFRENRKLNIGVVGQVKAGKSSFLNTLLFNGEEILPKASTPKTATLTKMEYSEHNIINVEYYSEEEWEELKEYASVDDSDDEIYTSAREIAQMVRRSGLDPKPYIEKVHEEIEFESYDDLISSLNDYVGEDGRYTPIVKAVTLYLNKEEFKGISIVDTPGLNDPILSRTLKTREFIEVCDVVFFLSQAGSFLDKSDWTLLSNQLPQKGVKRLVLVASKYDSGVRDILRVQDPDDIFGDDENTTDSIPKACSIIKRKLKKRARAKVEEYVKDLTTNRDSSEELINVIKQCSEPILVSSIACNMARKEVSIYTKEEQNVYYALKKFSTDIESDLRLLGNFDEINAIFSDVVAEKEAILEGKARSFIPTSQGELLDCLNRFKEKAASLLSALEKNDREGLLEQKNHIEAQINSIKADIITVFGEINTKLETEKAKGVREIREASKDYVEVKERIGSVTRCMSYTTGHWFWKSTHYYTYEEHYPYYLAADAIDNLKKYSMEAVNQVEEVFSEALELKGIKRRILDVVIKNFDIGSEKYDSSLFRILVEETVSKIEFPIFSIDIEDSINAIAAKFTGELKSADQRTALTKALSNAISRIYNYLSDRLVSTVANYKSEMEKISKTLETSLLKNVNSEFDMLLSQCEDKEKEINKYNDYINLLDMEIARLKEEVL